MLAYLSWHGGRWMVMMLCIVTVLIASYRCLGPLCCLMSRVSEGGAVDVKDVDNARVQALVSSSCIVAVLLLLCNIVASCVVVMSSSCIGAVLSLCHCPVVVVCHCHVIVSYRDESSGSMQ